MPPADRRRALLSAARDHFVEKGYHRTKVADIVRSAGVAQGTFYLYFPDKRSIFAALVDGVLERLGAVIVRVDVDAPIEPQVRANVDGVVGVLSEDPAVTRILLSYAAGLDPDSVDRVRAFYAAARGLLEESLATGQSIGIVKPGDPGLQATFIMGGLKELLLEWVYERTGLSIPERAEAVYALLQDTFLSVPADP